MDLISMITGMHVTAAICFIIGLVLVIFEMFHPGLSAPGIVGSILLVAGIIMTARSIFEAIILVLITLAILGIALTFVIHSATKGHLSKNLVHSESLKKEPRLSVNEDLDFFIGKEGTALTVLRPSGTADFEGVRLDVVSESEFIQKDAKVKISRLDGRKIIVREIKQ